MYNYPVIRFSALYPNAEGATFDLEYYRSHHIPLALEIWGLDSAEIDLGLEGPYIAASHFRFESLAALEAALASPGMAQLEADGEHFTNVAAVVQISEIVT